jgi:plastocyanin
MANSVSKGILLVTIATLVGMFPTACNQRNVETSYAGTGSRNATTQTGPVQVANPATNNGEPAKPSSELHKEMPAGAALNQVVMENFSFAPAVLTIKAGTKVTWINRDDVPHTATENDKRFNSGTMDTGGEFSFVFDSPGTYSYFCALHPRMTGQIIVK